jgi:hypothetical protein
MPSWGEADSGTLPKGPLAAFGALRVPPKGALDPKGPGTGLLGGGVG